MPDFTITLSQKAVQRLQTVLQRYNDNKGTKLSLKDFLHLHLREMAIADDLQVAIQAIAQQQKRDAEDTLQAAIRAQHDRLLQDL